MQDNNYDDVIKQNGDQKLQNGRLWIELYLVQ